MGRPGVVQVSVPPQPQFFFNNPRHSPISHRSNDQCWCDDSECQLEQEVQRDWNSGSQVGIGHSAYVIHQGVNGCVTQDAAAVGGTRTKGDTEPGGAITHISGNERVGFGSFWFLSALEGAETKTAHK